MSKFDKKNRDPPYGKLRLEKQDEKQKNNQQLPCIKGVIADYW